MNILSETYIFYADVYFIQNVIIKIAVIYLALFSSKCHIQISTLKGLVRIAGASLLGTLIEIAGLMWSSSYNLFLLLVHILEIPLMMWCVLGKERRQMMKVIVTGYFFIMVINGVLEAFWNWFGAYGDYIFYLCASCGLTYIGIRVWQRYSRMQKGIFLVEVFHNGQMVSIQGFYDSGNHLIDPYTGKGVHILSEAFMDKLNVDKTQMVLVPYQSLGNEGGVIEVFYAERMRIFKESEAIELCKVPIGVTEEKLFDEKKYEMILNEGVF